MPPHEGKGALRRERIRRGMEDPQALEKSGFPFAKESEILVKLKTGEHLLEPAETSRAYETARARFTMAAPRACRAAFSGSTWGAEDGQGAGGDLVDALWIIFRKTDQRIDQSDGKVQREVHQVSALAGYRGSRYSSRMMASIFGFHRVTTSGMKTGFAAAPVPGGALRPSRSGSSRQKKRPGLPR